MEFYLNVFIKFLWWKTNNGDGVCEKNTHGFVYDKWMQNKKKISVNYGYRRVSVFIVIQLYTKMISKNKLYHF